jgi:uncharacterized protein with GYD domain
VRKYLLEANYTLDGIKGLKAKGGSARLAAVKEATESAGGKVESFHFAFAETDATSSSTIPTMSLPLRRR